MLGFCFLTIQIYLFLNTLTQGFPNIGDFSNLEAKISKWVTNLIFENELILDIIVVQKKSKEKVLGVDSSNVETYTSYSGVEDKKKDLRGRFEKRVWETLLYLDNINVYAFYVCNDFENFNKKFT